jgi:putative FmdB family regulatory protein
MPFYEYQCEACGRHHEAMRKISDPPLRKCPACGKPRLKRLLSAPVFRLKGGGWYETDFKTDKEGRRNLAGDEGKADTHADAQGAGQGEVKPASAEGGKAGAQPEAKPEAKAEAQPESKPGAAPASKGAGESKPAVPAAPATGRRSVRRAAPAKPARKPPARGAAKARGTRGRR